MATGRLTCAACGAELKPLRRHCPACGAERQLGDASAAAAPPAGEEPRARERVMPGGMRLPVAPPSPAFPPPEAVYLSPEDEGRRFPLFTRYQLILIGLGIGLLIFLLVVAFLVWRQEQRDRMRAESGRAAAAPPAPVPATPPPGPEPSPSPTPLDDAALAAAVKAALTVYNPLGVARYLVEVKDGLVTLRGDAENQAERDGAENVIKPVAGVRGVINLLIVKTKDAAGLVKLNEAEARRLEEALRRRLQESEQESDEARRAREEAEARRASERRARELEAAQQREEEDELRQAAEERLRREAAEYERRQEESRRAEADRRARAEQARLEVSALRAGTIAWSGIVSGIDEIILTGASASVRHLEGEPPRQTKATFSAPMPRAPMTVRLLSANGRGTTRIVQEPSAANGYTTIIRIDDSDKGGDKRYDFALRWEAQ